MQKNSSKNHLGLLLTTTLALAGWAVVFNAHPQHSQYTTGKANVKSKLSTLAHKRGKKAVLHSKTSSAAARFNQSQSINSASRNDATAINASHAFKYIVDSW